MRASEVVRHRNNKTGLEKRRGVSDPRFDAPRPSDALDLEGCQDLYHVTGTVAVPA
jgi:hypothetical protein